MSNWYTSDTHFGHNNIIKYSNRPFKTVNEMDAKIIQNLWTKVGPEDDLWILGDFAFGAKSKDSTYLNKIYEQLPGARKHLVIGNHDLQPTLNLPWDSITNLSEIQDGPGSLRHTLCHYPMITWNHARNGTFQLFGHVHNNWLGSNNSINVGVDVWDFMPVCFTDITKRARSLPINKHWQDVEHGEK